MGVCMRWSTRPGRAGSAESVLWSTILLLSSLTWFLRSCPSLKKVIKEAGDLKVCVVLMGSFFSDCSC